MDDELQLAAVLGRSLEVGDLVDLDGGGIFGVLEGAVRRRERAR
jgi:hypothetical protein